MCLLYHCGSHQNNQSFPGDHHHQKKVSLRLRAIFYDPRIFLLKSIPQCLAPKSSRVNQHIVFVDLMKNGAPKAVFPFAATMSHQDC